MGHGFYIIERDMSWTLPQGASAKIYNWVALTHTCDLVKSMGHGFYIRKGHVIDLP